MKLLYIFTILVLSTVHIAQADGQDAIFKVINEIINDNVSAFTATVNSLGNSYISSGSFEPLVFRDMFIATVDSPDKVFADYSDITNWNTLGDGVLDGADVFVYRLQDGHFRLVKEDRIPEGGYHARGWIPDNNTKKLVAPHTTKFKYQWADWSRAGVKYFFTVRAVDSSGNMSLPSNYITVENPGIKSDGKVKNDLVKLKKSSMLFDSTLPDAPVGLQGRLDNNGILELTWQPSKANDLSGYMVYISDYSPDSHTGYYFDLETPAVTQDDYIRSGDMVIVSKKFYTASRKKFHSNRIWNAKTTFKKFFLPRLLDFFPDEFPNKTWELVKHSPNTPVENPGETFLEVKLEAGEKISLSIYNYAGIDQDWYDVLKTTNHLVELWLRQKPGGEGKAQFSLTGFYSKPKNGILPIAFDVGNEWKKYQAEFTPGKLYKQKKPGQMVLELSGPATFQLDNYRVYESGSGFLELEESEYSKLKQSGMRSLRTHAFIKTGLTTYDLEQLTNPAGVIRGTAGNNTLPQVLKIMEKAGVQPWLQIEPHFNPQEWRGLVEYLAAPYNPQTDDAKAKPWAYKRYMQGQKDPWIDEFDTIYFEIGNETWNKLFSPWIFNASVDAKTGQKYTRGQVYGLYQEYVIKLIKDSPWWKNSKLDKKMKFVIGGWTGQKFGIDAVTQSPSSNYMTIGAYNGGWDEDEGPPKQDKVSLFNVLQQVNQVAIPRAEKHRNEIETENTSRISPIHLGTYEAGPGYAMNGLNNAKVSKESAQEQELVMKSLAAGVATLDSFLARLYLGFDLQNYFTFGDGERWTSHAKWHRGGQAYPSWKLLELFNQQAQGQLLKIETIKTPVIDLEKYKKRKAVENAPMIAVYATKDHDRLNVFVISRKIPAFPIENDSGFTTVSLKLPVASAKKITLYRMAGDPFANNVKQEQVKVEALDIPIQGSIESFTINEKTGGNLHGLPPSSMFLYVFEDSK